MTKREAKTEEKALIITEDLSEVDIPMGSETAQKIQRERLSFFKCFVLTALMVSYTVFTTLRIYEKNAQSLEVTASTTNKIEEKVDLSKFEECTISFKAPEVKETWETKPMFLPLFPTSLDEEVHGRVISGLTGLEKGGKNFYRSAKGVVRQCIGNTESVTCTNIHPVVEMNGGPDRLSDKFADTYVMGIRNPMTALPAFFNEKQILYHGLKGQMDENQWRNARDTYLKDMFNDWASVLHAWLKSNYKEGMFLEHDDLLDTRTGPETLIRLSKVIEKAGFQVAPEEDIPCIWYQSVGKENIEQYLNHHYEHSDYLPAYTEEQKSFLLSEMSKLVTEYSEIEGLSSILKRYHDEIRDNIRIGIPYVKED